MKKLEMSSKFKIKIYHKPTNALPPKCLTSENICILIVGILLKTRKFDLLNELIFFINITFHSVFVELLCNMYYETR